jgi:hypothetical protein
MMGQKHHESNTCTPWVALTSVCHITDGVRMDHLMKMVSALQSYSFSVFCHFMGKHFEMLQISPFIIRFLVFSFIYLYLYRCVLSYHIQYIVMLWSSFYVPFDLARASGSKTSEDLCKGTK